jgi:hypothetical protein
MRLKAASSVGSGPDGFHGQWKNQIVPMRIPYAHSHKFCIVRVWCVYVLCVGTPAANAAPPVRCTDSVQLPRGCVAHRTSKYHSRDFERLGDRGYPYDAEFSLLPQLAKVRLGALAAAFGACASIVIATVVGIMIRLFRLFMCSQRADRALGEPTRAWSTGRNPTVDSVQ